MKQHITIVPCASEPAKIIKHQAGSLSSIIPTEIDIFYIICANNTSMNSVRMH